MEESTWHITRLPCRQRQVTVRYSGRDTGLGTVVDVALAGLGGRTAALQARILKVFDNQTCRNCPVNPNLPLESRANVRVSDSEVIEHAVCSGEVFDDPQHSQYVIQPSIAPSC